MAVGNEPFGCLLDQFRRRFAKRGEFLLRPGQSVNQVVRGHVPDGYGVYVVSSCRGQAREPIYIGRAGTLMQNGTMKEQGIRKRLTMKQEGVYRAEFFQQMIAEEGLDALHFEWFVTFEPPDPVLPMLAEAQLVAAFYDTHRCLPSRNRCA